MSDIGNPPLPLQTIIEAYPYQQYADDANVAAFFAAYNTLAQIYLTWLNNTPLAVYTNPAISGPLLDWIGQGIYGVPRPVFSSLTTSYMPADVNGAPLNTVAINSSSFSQSGTATLATDDYYKRVLTWLTYIGNGRYFNIPLLRLRIARFIYGVNGGDVTLDQAQTVHIVPSGSGEPTRFTITLPVLPAVYYFQQALAEGIISLPFQLSAVVFDVTQATQTTPASATVASYATATSSAIVKVTAAKTTPASALVYGGGTGYMLAASQAMVRATTSKTVGASGIVKATTSKTTTASSIVQAQATQTTPASANVGTPETVVVAITSGSSYTVPSNFGSLVSIECVGAGQNGKDSDGSNAGGIGGDYAKIISLPGIGPSDVYSLQVGVNGAVGTDTWFDSTTTVLAKGGGSSSTTYGSTAHAGGTGGAGSGHPTLSEGGGGGGAAGPNGNGTNGANATSSGGAGGSGDNGSGGSGGAGATGSSAAVAGSAGTEWTITAGGTAGPGGGGGGGAAASLYNNGANGGSHGAGGGGAGVVSSTPGAAGTGAPGIIIFTYLTP